MRSVTAWSGKCALCDQRVSLLVSVPKQSATYRGVHQCISVWVLKASTDNGVVLGIRFGASRKRMRPWEATLAFRHSLVCQVITLRTFSACDATSGSA